MPHRRLMTLSLGSFFFSPDVSIRRAHDCSLHAESSWNQRGLMSSIQITAKLFLTQDAKPSQTDKRNKRQLSLDGVFFWFPKMTWHLYEAPAIKLKVFREAALWCLTDSQPSFDVLWHTFSFANWSTV